MTRSWPVVRLSEVLHLDLDRVYLDPATTYEMAGVLSFGRGLFLRESVSGANTSYKFFYRLKADHVVMSQLFGWEGALALSSDRYEGLHVSPQFPTFLCDARRLDRKFLGYAMRRRSFWEDLGTRTKGMGDRRRTLNPEALFASEIPLPPLDEQRRIVTRIETLAGKTEEAKCIRETSAIEAGRLIPSVLQKVAKNQLRGTATGTLGTGLSSARNGLSRRPSGIESGPVVLRLADVAEGRVNLTSVRRGTLSKAEIEAYQLCKGDLLFVRVNGSLGIVGRCIMFNGATDVICFNDHLIRVRLDTDLFMPAYVVLLANGPVARLHIESSAITTAGQFTVNQQMLMALPIPVLPLSEQRRIVAHLDALQAKVDALKRLQSETAAELDALIPSILEKAFKGEL